MVMLDGFTPAEVAAAVRQMGMPHKMRTRTHLLDLNHRFLGDLSGLRVGDGSNVTVQADQVASPTRSMSLELWDPTDVLGLSGASSAPTFLAQTWKGLYVEELGRWMDFPVICAWVTKPSRRSDVLTIDGQDKAALALQTTTPMTLKKGTNVATAIRSLLSTRCGETRFRLATTSAKLARDYVLDDQTTPWALAQTLAEIPGWVLFYDGLGYCVGRVPSLAPVYTFRSGTHETLASAVQLGFWEGEIYNRVVLDGPVVSGKKVTATAVLPVNHELSPENLMRGGVLESGYRTFRYASSSVTDRAAAERWVNAKLKSLALQQQTAAWDSAAVWHLQEHDVVGLVDDLDGINAEARWITATIPLGCDGTQANGYNRRVGRAFSRGRTTSARKVIKKKKRR